VPVAVVRNEYAASIWSVRFGFHEMIPSYLPREGTVRSWRPRVRDAGGAHRGKEQDAVIVTSRPWLFPLCHLDSLQDEATVNQPLVRVPTTCKTFFEL
jgi:hypothetical protein